MIQAIIKGIACAIYEEFGEEYTIYSEEIKQGLKEPCFIISCVRAGYKPELNNKYTQSAPFWVQYIPKETGQKNEECHSVAERLNRCLEYITVGGDLVRGVDKSHEAPGGILTFSVTYNMRLIAQSKPPEDEMEELQRSVDLKG